MLFNYTPSAVALLLLTSAAQADSELVVVADIAPVHSLTAQVMAGVGEPVLLVEPGTSPHHFALRPSQADALQKANAVFWVGPDLSPWLETALDGLGAASSATALMELEASQSLVPRDNPIFESKEEEHDDHDHEEDHDDHAHDEKHDDDDHDDHAHGEKHDDEHHDEHAHDEKHDDEHGEEDHAEGHDHGHEHTHGDTDPHGWLDPENAALWLDVIAKQLSEISPENADAFKANAEAAKKALSETVTEVEATLAPVQDHGFIVFHDAFQYFENRFGLNSLGSVAVSDATSPSPKRLAELRAHIRHEQPACAFSEPQLDTKLLGTALEGTDTKIAELDPLGSSQTPGATLYNELLLAMARSIATCAD